MCVCVGGGYGWWWWWGEGGSDVCRLSEEGVMGRRGGRGLKVMGPPWGGDGGGAWGEETVHRIPSRQTHTTHLPVRPGMERGKEGRAISTPPL